MEDAAAVGWTLLALKTVLANGTKTGMLERKDREAEMPVLTMILWFVV